MDSSQDFMITTEEGQIISFVLSHVITFTQIKFYNQIRPKTSQPKRKKMNLFFPPKHSPATKLLIASFFGPIRGKNCGNYDFHVIKQLFKYRLSYCRLTQKDINCSNQDFFGSSCYQKKKLFTAVN